MEDVEDSRSDWAVEMDSKSKMEVQRAQRQSPVGEDQLIVASRLSQMSEEI